MRIVLLVTAAMIAAVAAPARAGPGAAHPVSVKQLPKGLKAPKNFTSALGWADHNGDAYLIFSDVTDEHEEGGNSRYLQVDFVVVPAGGKAKTLRTVKDKVEECEEDLTAEFIDAATEVTDLDGDGAAEATFAYRVSCKGDVSPDTIKVLTLENGDKYILRGDDFFDDGSGKRKGGTFKPDPAPAKWPPPFLDHAKATWKKIVK
jgi:hypothetical protein